MNEFASTTQQHLLKRAAKGPATTADEHIGVNGTIAAWLTKRVGSMWVVYSTSVVVLVWMALGT